MSSLKKPKALLPHGAVWETRTDPCLKCRKPYMHRGYRTKDGRWIGSHLCLSCNESNVKVREPRFTENHPIPNRVRKGM